MAGRLDGRVAIVTGAARGLGALYAKAMAGEGARVVVTDINDCGESEAAIAAAHPGAETLALTTDVRDPAACEALVARTVERFGKLDILVNNAAVFADLPQVPFWEIDIADWDLVMAVNIRGPFLCARAAAPHMRRQRYGKIVNIASGTLFRGVPLMTHYVSSKGAVLAMTRSMSRELGDDNICVNTLAPGLTLTEAVKSWTAPDVVARNQATVQARALKREQMPEDMVGALLFLVSPDSDFMTGQCMVVDGGATNH